MRFDMVHTKQSTIVNRAAVVRVAVTWPRDLPCKLRITSFVKEGGVTCARKTTTFGGVSSCPQAQTWRLALTVALSLPKTGAMRHCHRTANRHCQIVQIDFPKSSIGLGGDLDSHRGWWHPGCHCELDSRQ